MFMIFNLKKFLNSFKAALEGLKSASSEQTFRICCFFAILVIILMILFKVPFYQKLILILIITFILSLELINSRIERILDVFQPNHDPRVKVIKDIAAAAVLLACLGALALGILIFLPHFLSLFF